MIYDSIKISIKTKHIRFTRARTPAYDLKKLKILGKTCILPVKTLPIWSSIYRRNNLIF